MSARGASASLTIGSPEVKKSMMVAKTSGLITFHSVFALT